MAATSISNTIADALPGVTLTLTGLTTTTTGTGTNATTSDTPATLSVTSDTATIESNISAFVTAYNTLIQSFQSLGGYDSTTSTAGPMMGNALLSSTQSQIQNAMYSIVNTGSSTYDSLASIGITTNSDGSLSLNSSTLSNAMSTNFSAVSALFSSTNGVASSLNAQITLDLSSTGAIAENSTSLTNQTTALDQQTTSAHRPNGGPDGEPDPAVFGLEYPAILAPDHLLVPHTGLCQPADRTEELLKRLNRRSKGRLGPLGRLSSPTGSGRYIS